MKADEVSALEELIIRRREMCQSNNYPNVYSVITLEGKVPCPVGGGEED